MSRVRAKGTKPEMAVRRLVHSMGYRYRLHRADLPGRPDLAFVGRKKVIFVHGCFWHQHAGCKGARVPKSNSGYWSRKLARNVQRDSQNQTRLREAGWDSLIVWECEIDMSGALPTKLRQFLER